METEDYRLQLEQTIIGTCLLENGYDRIAGVVSHKNFNVKSPFDHQAIFQAIEVMYPDRPIDLLTVTHELNQPFYAGYLAHCSNLVSSSANLRYHGFILLQLSMRDALIRALSYASERELGLTTKAALQDIIDECLDSDNDILEIYEKSPSYLQSIGVEDNLLAEINKLKEGLQTKVDLIKKQAQVDCLIQRLERLQQNGSDIKSRLCLAKLTEMIKAIIVKGTVSDETLEIANAMESSLRDK